MLRGEVRHERRRGRDRGDRRAGRAARAGVGGGPCRRDRERDRRRRDAAGRHRPRARRHDDRAQQPGRRGPARARRLHRVCEAPRVRAARRHRDPDRGEDQRARDGLRGPVRQRRAPRRQTSWPRSGPTGELAWRLPLHRDYAAETKGRYAELTNRPEPRRGLASAAAELLHHFAGDTPWAHLDIAGMAHDLRSEYLAATGATGWGVRLLELAVRVSAGVGGPDRPASRTARGRGAGCQNRRDGVRTLQHHRLLRPPFASSPSRRSHRSRRSSTAPRRSPTTSSAGSASST